MPQLLLLLRRGAPLLAGVVVLAAACNSVSGVNDLTFDDTAATQSASGAAGAAGGLGGGASASATAGGNGDGTGTASSTGGSGGADCGPCDVAPICQVWTGFCIAGDCVWTNAGLGDACDDGNDCTEGDACDDSGHCAGATPAGDGKPCGAKAPADRCCAGQCRDLTSDPMNCGGCGLACGSGVCEPIDLTTDCNQGCSPEPCDSMAAMTSGRCKCIGIGECPGDGQVCVDQPPVTLRCAPETDAHCADGQIMIAVDQCPNYCIYPD